MANKLIYIVVAVFAFDYIRNYLQDKKVGEFFSEIGYVSPSKYDHLHEHKFATDILTQRCIKFHDSEIVSVDLSRTVGRWDAHLANLKLPFEYEYVLVDYVKEEQLADYNYLPVDFHSKKVTQNDSNIVKVWLPVSSTFGINIDDNDAMIGIKYDSYFLKYTCVNILGLVSGSIYLQLRPEMSAQLNMNPNLFSQIIDSIPEKSLIKIRKLIENLVHQNDPNFENFGKNYIKSLNQRIDNFLKVNELSDKTDEQVFDFLTEKCHQFNEYEENVSDNQYISLETLSTNWRLDYSNYNNPKIPFDRMLIKRRSNNSFAVKLYNGEKYLANSDYYYDPTQGVFWAYTEGRRSREECLFANNDYRITYTCDERVINGKLESNEILRFYSSENTTNSGDWNTYLDLLGKSQKHQILEQLLNFGQNISPFMSGVFDKNVKLSVKPKHSEL